MQGAGILVEEYIRRESALRAASYRHHRTGITGPDARFTVAMQTRRRSRRQVDTARRHASIFVIHGRGGVE